MQSADPAWSRSISSVSGVAAQVMLPILGPEDVSGDALEGKELQSLGRERQWQ
jgi:hypothetical protein